ncbi:hypothetical protein N8I84_27380 [Streptomyces cynarae]|uniref:Membrane-bound hydrophilic protein n=1 Tax=Streptomyces cynarae TaxID=2981134 RepID=A0ABY6E5V0_9ACTN|nr:hypothetical protein [Streptomyces cynarae]UXY22012.1 hypothetical protein N8I84_27380 [Streptomyces cynarae]
MPADEVTHGADADASRVRTGPRHAAPRKPLFTRFHMPAGKAIALAAMPTAVLMGMGLTPTLARAADHTPSSKNLTVDEYQKCVEALDNSKDASSSPSPSSSASASPSKSADTPEPTSSASPEGTSGKASGTTSGKTSSSDSGSDDKAVPTPSKSTSGTSSGGGASTPSPSASASGGNLLETIGDAITGVFTGGSGSGSGSSASPSATPSPSASASATKGTAAPKDLSGTVKDTTGKVTGTVKDTVKGATKAASEATKAAGDTVKAAESAAASPSPSSGTSAEDCPAATDDEGGVEKILSLPDKPWHLQASSLLLKGADYQGVVKVRTANGTIKRVLKYVISDGTEIGDLHQLVDGPNGVTYHVQGAKGSKSTITGGKTVMYTESISGNLLGLIPVTFSPDNPPPLNIPLIYFTNVKVTQAGQFGGTLTIPGMRQYVTGAN